MTIRAVALDAMGVIYRYGNVVDRVLLPYVRAQGCTLPDSAVRDAYRSATLGLLSTARFWKEIGLDEGDEAYCQRHELTPDAITGLERMAAAGLRLICLSNDTAAWSLILRRRFGLERYVGEWYISSELGARKPDPAPYQILLDTAALAPEQVVFVDDRPTNLATAQRLGMQTVLFRSDDTHAHLDTVPSATPSEEVSTLPQLSEVLSRLTLRRGPGVA